MLKFIQEDKHFSRYYDAIYILFHTGLRISEFCGLTVSEIEFGEMRIKVDHQLQRTAQMQYVIEEPLQLRDDVSPFHSQLQGVILQFVEVHQLVHQTELQFACQQTTFRHGLWSHTGVNTRRAKKFQLFATVLPSRMNDVHFQNRQLWVLVRNIMKP